MSTGQDMSPDFVLMRLVSAAEEDRLDAENGNLSAGTGGAVPGYAQDVLSHGNVKGKLDCAQNQLSAGNKAPQCAGSEAPDAGVMASRDALALPPPPLHSAQARAYDLSHRRGIGPQLLVFRNVSRDPDGLSANNADASMAFEEHTSESSGSAHNNNAPSAGDAQQHQYHPPWALHPELKLSTAHTDSAELCHRHRIISEKRDWPQIVDKSKPTAVLDPAWSVRAQGELRLPDRPALELARQFGELGVTPVPEFLLKDGDLQHCSCSTTPGIRQGEDPSETSDALLVLEGLGSEEVNNSESQDGAQVKTQLALKCFPSVLSGQAVGVAGGLCLPACRDSQLCCLLRGSLSIKAQSNTNDRDSTQFPSSSSSSSVEPVRPASASSSLGSNPSTQSAGASRVPCSEKALKVPAKSRKGSLKIRLSKLFRTKSCSGSNSLLDKRPSVTFSISSAGSLVDMSGVSTVEHDTASQPGLSRAQSAFSGAAFTPVFTGETVSLVDVDISQRGRNSPHPPTPPPPPRRSLSLLDAFFRALPHSSPSPIETPPPMRVAPSSNVCPLRGVDSSSFTASLRELERCGWYWGPMNWEDAELKLKGKPDGSFLVRDSSDPRYILSLSFRSQGVTHHTRMEHYRGTFSLWCHPKFEDRCHSVVEFIERAIMHSKNGKFLYFLRSRVPGLPPTPVQLLYPVSRFCNVKSLQHLCRFCIRQLVRIDHIQELPLPNAHLFFFNRDMLLVKTRHIDRFWSVRTRYWSN
ncbi:suppressor of cytokine signaling 7-like isoform X2 [Clarias magur]|uniref:Suppressor of cytokine signaling 7 n=1 Tax=Clarias magur TaxID=1594786 RepID=A0A8J4XH60_CLAMG|nr:suppressor of cytokine signaling 7-like isoform X2 [Clarias magur]